MLHWLSVAMTKRPEAETGTTKLRIPRFALGVLRVDRIRSEYIGGSAHMNELG